MRVERVFGVFLSIVLSSLAGGGCVAPAERDSCLADAGSSSVIGVITTGKDAPTGGWPVSTYPVDFKIRLTSQLLINEVHVGDVQATLLSAGDNTWEAQLSEADVEKHRSGAAAPIAVVAVDLCHREWAIDTATLVLGPAPDMAVKDLKVSLTSTPSTECSLPVDQSVPAAVTVTASADSAGAKVTLATNQGTFAGGASSVTVPLVKAGAVSAWSGFVVPGREGSLVVTASAMGAVGATAVMPVVAAPSITEAATTLKRSLDYFATARTEGNFASCLVEEAIAGASTVTLVDPARGPIMGSIKVKLAPVTCTDAETLRLKIAFTADAPTGAAVTLRCFDTFNQEGHATFTVEPKP